MARGLEVRHCEALIAVADAGSVGAAARSLGWAQSTVSETCLSLERVVGRPVIFRRHGLEATLSPVGVRLLPQARRVVEAARSALAAVRTEGGAIRLGTTESIGSFLVPPAVSAMGEHGGLPSPEVTIGLCAELRALVASGTLDLCVTMEGRLPPDDAAVTCSRIGTVSLTLFVGGDADRIRFDDLRGGYAELLLPDPEGSLTSHVRAWMAGEGVRARVRSAGSVDGVRRSVRMGDAVGVLPTYALVDELRDGTVRPLEVPGPDPMALLATVGVCAADPEGCARLADGIADTLRSVA